NRITFAHFAAPCLTIACLARFRFACSPGPLHLHGLRVLAYRLRKLRGIRDPQASVNRFLRYASLVVGALVVLIRIAVLAFEQLAERKRNRVVALEVAPVAYVDDDAARARGKYLFDSRGCMECHGANGRGKVFIDDPNGMFVRTPNITSGGVTKGYAER